MTYEVTQEYAPLHMKDFPSVPSIPSVQSVPFVQSKPSVQFVPSTPSIPSAQVAQVAPVSQVSHLSPLSHLSHFAPVSHLGIMKSKIAFWVSQEFVTLAFVPSAHVVVVPTSNVAASHSNSDFRHFLFSHEETSTYTTISEPSGVH